MYPKGLKRQLLEAAALIFAASYVGHLAAAWLGTIIPSLLAVALLIGIYRLLFRRWRR